MLNAPSIPSSGERFFQTDEGSFRNWPISHHGLRALRDLGLADEAIAAYFGVGVEAVTELARSYELN